MCLPMIYRLCESSTATLGIRQAFTGSLNRRGADVRIDTTLVGFDHTSWKTGHRSFIFRYEDDSTISSLEVDHDTRTALKESIGTTRPGDTSALTLDHFQPDESSIAERLLAPVVTTYVDVEKIEFERSKSGIWGWRNDKVESIGGYECRVFTATNVNLITKTRTEHLTAADREQSSNDPSASPLDSFMRMLPGSHEVKVSTPAKDEDEELTEKDYFDPELSLQGRDIGRPKDQKIRSQSFQASLWLSDLFPLSLPEQVTPIIDLMAANNAHFARLKNFIELQLPAGFPVKIEIPLFHVLTAHITFGNMCAIETPVDGVSNSIGADGASICSIDPAIFQIPADYRVIGLGASGAAAVLLPSNAMAASEEDQLLQFVLHQSMNDQLSTTPHIPEAASRFTASFPMGREELDLQRAINASLNLGGFDDDDDSVTLPPSYEQSQHEQVEDELTKALRLSQQEEAERERAEREEQEQLDRILKLSLEQK